MTRETSVAVIRCPHLAILAATLLTWPAAVATSQALPLDPAVMVDSLPNGLRYYIRANKRPEQRAELRLVVRAGSVLERDDERGLAHFVEHMAFEGSTHFARSELVHYLESVGIRFGADLNAYTSFDETVYMLSLPTDTANIVDHAFTVLADWAGGVTFDSTAVERERGVIIEEWRLGQGAQQRVSNEQRPVMLHGSRYAERMPIGDTVVIRTASAATMRGFWKRWYRPDLMAVVAVGDFDPAAVAQLIRDHFGALARPSTPHGRPATTAVPPHAETLVTVAVDPELSGSSVSLLAKHVREPVATEAAWRRRMVDRFAGQLLNERLDEVRQRPNAPFVYAYGGTTGLVKSTDAFQLVAVVKDGGIADGLAAVVREAARAGRFGFRASELERAQRDLLRQFESANEERDKTPSASHAADYVSHFVDGAPAMGIAREYALAQQYIPGITLGEVNAVAAAWLRAGSRVLAASLPRKDDVPVPTDGDLLAVVDRVSAEPLIAWVDSVSTAPLVRVPPTPGRVVATATIPSIGVTEWTLANGVRVVVKPTAFQADEILLEGFREGGTSAANDSVWRSARWADMLIGASGLGELSAVSLQKRLAGVDASAAAELDTHYETVSGRAARKDVETMFQLAYLSMTAPREDSVAVGTVRRMFEFALANRGKDPASVFGDTVAVALAQGHLRAQPLNADEFRGVDYHTALQFYRERFATADGFTFVLVGNVEADSIRPLVERWLGGLPAGKQLGGWVDRGIRAPRGRIDKVVRMGIEPRARVELAFSGPGRYNRVERYRSRAVAEILEHRLRERLRDALGSTYSVSVGARVQRIPVFESHGEIEFGCAPERVDELIRAVYAELDSLQRAGPTAAELKTLREGARRSYETDLKRNGYWAANLVGKLQTHEDLRDMTRYGELMDALTARDVQQAALRFFPKENRARFVLLPAAPAGVRGDP